MNKEKVSKFNDEMLHNVNKMESNVDQLMLSPEAYICGLNAVLSKLIKGMEAPILENDTYWYSPKWEKVDTRNIIEFNLLNLNFIMGDLYTSESITNGEYKIGKLNYAPPTNVTVIDNDKCTLQFQKWGDIVLNAKQTISGYIGSFNFTYPTSKRFTWTGAVTKE